MTFLLCDEFLLWDGFLNVSVMRDVLPTVNCWDSRCVLVNVTAQYT